MSAGSDRARSASPLLRAALLALAYFVAGRVSLLLAIPPGYATAIWPGAGIALAALLVYGRGLWPGVAVGSMLVNLGIGTDAGLAAITPEKLIVAAAIGCGAALQALAGYALTQGLLRRDPELLQGPNIAGLLILGGPLSCLVNPTFGVGVLLIGELIVPDEFGFSWMTWWVGDSMGVLICLPLLLLWLGPPKRTWAKFWGYVAAPLALVLALSVVVFVYVSRQEQRALALEFEHSGAIVARSLEKQFERSLEAVYGLRSFFLASSEVTRSEFGAFAGRSLTTLQTVHALSWDPVVRDTERAAFEEAQHQAGLPQFRVSEQNARGELVAAGQRPAYVVVQFIEPLLRNAQALGYDAYSQQDRREALDLARDSGQAVATKRVQLVQDSPEHPGMLVYVPVYTSHATPVTLAERRSELRGFVVGVFSSGELVSGALQGLGAVSIDVQLLDETDPDAKTLLAAYRFDEQGVGHLTNAPVGVDTPKYFSHEAELIVAARKWRLRLTADKAYVASRRTWAGWGALVGGLLFSSMLGFLLLALTARRISDARRAAELAETNRTLSDEVAQRMRIEQALHAEKERVEVTLHSIGDAVIATDAKAVVEYLNPAAERMTEWTVEEARGKPVNEVFKVFNVETRQPESNPVERCLETGQMLEVTKPLLLISRLGREYAIADSVAPIRDPQDHVQGAVLVFHDVTETHRMARAAEYQASHDSLTGLVNRAEFEKRVERALASSKQYGRQHALCYLDLDQFKVVNDTCGHRAGDVLLRGLTSLLAHAVRERDTLARLGGDEFGLLLENCPLPKSVQIAEALVGLVRDYRFEWDAKPFTVGVSIGLVPVAGQVETADVLLAHADAACYAAKELGRNRVHVYQADDSGADPHHRAILRVTDIRTAIDRDRFQLFSQPIWTVDSDPPRLTAHELLLRMVDNNGALVQPGFFIPVAERFGLMDKIDHWVIEHTFRSYHSLFPGDSSPSIAINLSGNVLGEEKLLSFLHGQFDTHQIAPNKVCFEITETAAIRNISAAKLLIKELRGRGCKFALDDFGSGLSSFGYLKALPVDYLKIDGSLVRRIAEESTDRAMVEAINRLAHQMGMHTIAEYVESTQCLQVLREIGVDQAQGYALGMPTRVYQVAPPVRAAAAVASS
jgi:diguanylate cyclase (GGDEF)-like protein/PAS domain S-box-containing protein